MDENDKGYTEGGLQYEGVHVSKLWPNSPLMGGATRRQIQEIIKNSAPRDEHGTAMVADYTERVNASDAAWAERGIDETKDPKKAR